MFTTADIASTTTYAAGEFISGFSMLTPCGGILTTTRGEFGPEAGEISWFSGTERYIFDMDAPVELILWKE